MPPIYYRICLLGTELQPVGSVAEAREKITLWQDSLGDQAARDGTALQRALSQVRTLFPSGYVSRVIVCSDGRPTDGRLDAMLQQLETENIYECDNIIFMNVTF